MRACRGSWLTVSVKDVEGVDLDRHGSVRAGRRHSHARVRQETESTAASEMVVVVGSAPGGRIQGSLSRAGEVLKLSRGRGHSMGLEVREY